MLKASVRDFTTSLQRAAPVETLYDLRRLASSTVEPLEDDFGEKSLHFRLILEMRWAFLSFWRVFGRFLGIGAAEAAVASWSMAPWPRRGLRSATPRRRQKANVFGVD